MAITPSHFVLVFIFVVIIIFYQRSYLHSELRSTVTCFTENIEPVNRISNGGCDNDPLDDLLDNPGQSWKTILFWHDWFGQKWSVGFGAEDAFGLRKYRCPSFRCEFTYDKFRIDEADAVVFRYSELEIVDLPFRTSQDQRWIWLNREAPPEEFSLNKTIEMDTMNVTELFNWTMTYHTNADIMASYGHFASLIDLDSQVPLRPNLMSEHWKTLLHYKHALHSNINISEILGPFWRTTLVRPRIVAWMSSHCNTTSGREYYVEELEKYLEVDKYGKCGTNDCGERNPRGDWCWEEILQPKYMFYLAMENVFCEDYITEKVYLPLLYNMVPVVFGGADYSRFLPPGSYIKALDYHPKDLANFLKQLSQDPIAYSRYHIWRGYWTVHLGASLCEMCHRLLIDKKHSHYQNLVSWRNKNGKCNNETYNIFP